MTEAAGPSENPDLIALGTVLSGLALALAGGTTIQALAPVSGAMATTLLPVGLSFVLGAYLGASAFWLAARRRVDIVPLRVALGALMGAALGLGMALLAGMVVAVPPPIAAGVSALGAFYVARLATLLRRAKPDDVGIRLARVGLVGTAIAVAIALILVGSR